MVARTASSGLGLVLEMVVGFVCENNRVDFLIHNTGYEHRLVGTYAVSVFSGIWRFRVQIG